VKKSVNQQGTEWEVGLNPAVETIIGDTTWTNYEVHTDVNVTENTGYAKILGRIMDVKRGGDFPEGYTFTINTSDKWLLYAGNEIIARGNAYFPPFNWHHLSLKFNEKAISVFLNGNEIVKVYNEKYTHGVAGLGSGFNFIEFDNFEVK